MRRGIKIKWGVLIAVIILAVVISIIAFPTVVQAEKSNFKQFYKYVECKKCETKYDENYKDSYGDPRQFGVKMCEEHQNRMSKEASWESHPSKNQVAIYSTKSVDCYG